MATRHRSRAEAQKAPRSKATFDMDAAVLEEMRAAVVSVPLREIGGSLSGLVESALQEKLAKLRRKWNKGRPFKVKGEVQVPRGRPPRTAR
jgi:hypothetical protein